MAKESKKKVYTRNSPKYTSSSDDDSSDERDMNLFFKGLIRDHIAKVNELIKVVNEKDELLEKQEDLLTDETRKNEKLEKALAHEKEKIKILTHELKTCNDSISSLQCANDDLSAKIVKLNECHASFY
jgi:septal ring factor EnvC (AmiA/AmiB activator)